MFDINNNQIRLGWHQLQILSSNGIWMFEFHKVRRLHTEAHTISVLIFEKSILHVGLSPIKMTHWNPRILKLDNGFHSLKSKIYIFRLIVAIVRFRLICLIKLMIIFRCSRLCKSRHGFHTDIYLNSYWFWSHWRDIRAYLALVHLVHILSYLFIRLSKYRCRR